MFRPVSAGKKAALVLACVSMAASLVFSGAARAADMIKVLIDEAKVFEYPDGVSTIIIGNPVVADITMLRKNNRMILTGKSFGRTNLLMLDNQGNAIAESVVQVSANFKDLIVQRGFERESYDCSPRCHPTINAGDSQKFMGETAGGIKQHNGLSGAK